MNKIIIILSLLIINCGSEVQETSCTITCNLNDTLVVGAESDWASFPCNQPTTCPKGDKCLVNYANGSVSETGECL